MQLLIWICIAFAWFSIPLGLCATMSFVSVVLQDTEYWPVAGGVTAYQINNSLILPLAAQATMGIGGVVAVILMVRSFMKFRSGEKYLLMTSGFHGGYFIV